MSNTDTKILERKELAKKLTAARTRLLFKYPFFGSLVMGLKVGMANIGTAATDMRRIIWDPAFLSRLDEDEVEFVTMHELMHCALKHCTRGKDLDPELYNIACDIVVNSTILNYLKLSEFEVDGEPVIHKTPNGAEGCIFTAEEVYRMLQTAKAYNQGKGTLDNHGVWKKAEANDKYLDQQWKEKLLEAMKKEDDFSLDCSAVRELVDNYEYQARVDWKSVLHDFVQIVYDKMDYTFSPYDRRFAHTDFYLPAFNEIESEQVSNLWFAVDNSGSITNDTLGMVVSEIKASVDQFERLSGKISFFDTKVSKPIEFSGEVCFPKLDICGGGGTSFHAVFKYMKEYMQEDLPTAVIILTDGHAIYPPEDMALGVPVLWILVDNEKDAPWGISTHIEM